MIIKAAPEIGGEYQSYAPGHGGLAFVHVVNGKATNEPVPKSKAELLLPDGWDLAEINGRLEGHREIWRLGANQIYDKDSVYRYEALEINGAFRYDFYVLVDSEWEPLRNESRRASLRYFLTHESLLAGQK